jgi:hypothetical protein
VATDAACCNAAGVFWRVRRRQSVLDLLVCAGTDGQGRSAEVEEVGLRYVREMGVDGTAVEGGRARRRWLPAPPYVLVRGRP